MKQIVLSVLLSCAIGIAYSQADRPTTEEKYTVSGGLLLAGNLTDFRVTGSNSNGVDYDSKLGWSAGAWLSFPIGSTFSLEPQVMYSSYRYRTNSTSATPLLLNDGSVRYVSIPLLLKIHASERVAITAGPQLDIVTGVDDDANLADEEDFNKSSLSLSAGVELFPRGPVTPFARYIHGMSNMDNRPGHSSAMEYKNQNIQVGLKIKLFGKKKEVYQAAATPVVVPDSDGDGITDDVDKCPNQAGLARYNGCPIPDSDGDGINDEEDKCPNQAGTAKYNGCPIPDTDGDGINDEEDKCPNEKGTADRNGCPASDRDGDGVTDENDRCPDLAGTVNGCPEVASNVTKMLQSASMNVAFGTGANNKVLTTKSNTSLDKIVTIMNENPGLHIRVEAHTDNAGDDDTNMTLTTDRANAVKGYLVSKGISADRIHAEGFGETMPIADNNTSAGRTKNRRVEIKMMD